MRKTIILYGITMAVLLGILRVVDYNFFVRDLSAEVYVGILALFFTSFGAWAGWKLTHRQKIVIDPNFVLDESKLIALGISKREYEVLLLIAQGLSNQEIADTLFVSPHTVKSHSSSLFSKLNARRRTEAMKKAKELQLLP